MNDETERLAVLETKMNSLEDKCQEINEREEQHMKQIYLSWDKLNEAIQNVATQIKVSKSFIGGIVFVISALWALVVVFSEYIFHIGGK